MPDNTLFLHRKKIGQYPIVLILLPVADVIKTMHEAIIDIICLQRRKHEINLFPHFLEIKCPAIFTRLIIRTEMHLVKHVAADA